MLTLIIVNHQMDLTLKNVDSEFGILENYFRFKQILQDFFQDVDTLNLTVYRYTREL